MGVGAVVELPAQLKFALAGALAVLLGRHARDWSLTFCERLLRLVVLSVLRLEEAQFDALAPLLSASAEGRESNDSSDPTAFLGVLPRSPQMRQDILCGLLAMFATGVGDEQQAKHMGYDARARQLLCELASALDVPWPVLAAHERTIAMEMKSVQLMANKAKGKKGGESSAQEVGGTVTGKGSSKAKWNRRIAIASVGVISGLTASLAILGPQNYSRKLPPPFASGALIGVTGGLAAPAVIGGLAAVGGGMSSIGGAAALIGASVTGVAGLLAGTGGVVIVTTIFGATGGGLVALKMGKRLGDVKEFEFTQPVLTALPPIDPEMDELALALDTQPRPGLVVVIGVSGWLSKLPDSHARHWFGAAAPACSAAKEASPGFGGQFWRKFGESRSSNACVAGPATVSAGTDDATMEANETDLVEETMEDRVEWLVAMGFPEGEVRRVASMKTADGGAPSTEQMVDKLLERGVKLKLDVESVPVPASALSESPCAELSDIPGLSKPQDANSTGDYEADVPCGSVLLPAIKSISIDQPLLDSEASAVVSESSYALTASAEVSETGSYGIVESLPFAELYALTWESRELRALGLALGRIAATEAVSMIGSQALKHTFFSALMAAVALPAIILKACSILDHPWAIAYERAGKTGALLAQVLLSHTHGHRPVVLVGFGLGAKVIFDALRKLLTMLEAGEVAAAGIVQHVVLMGLPATSDAKQWDELKRVVAGRIVNGYRPNDVVLSLVYRTSNLARGIAGLGPVASAAVENFDLSGVVTAHHKYRHHVKDVLQLVHLEGMETPETGVEDGTTTLNLCDQNYDPVQVD